MSVDKCPMCESRGPCDAHPVGNIGSGRCAVGCAPVCSECGRRKAPRGRSVAPEMANGMCDHQCPGYYECPTPCDLWPGEEREPTADLAARGAS